MGISLFLSLLTESIWPQSYICPKIRQITVVWRNLTQLNLFSQKLEFILLFGFLYFLVKKKDIQGAI